jgi:large subunit ribosomal protein L18
MGKQETNLQRRQRRVRAKLSRINKSGLPRLSVFRSGRQIYAQVIDDSQGLVLANANTLQADIKSKLKNGSTADAAAIVGKVVAERAKKAGVEKVMFDRGAYLYHGRVKALAEGAREGGLVF